MVPSLAGRQKQGWDRFLQQNRNPMLQRLFRTSANRRVIDSIHAGIVAAARQPALFLDYGVPDSLAGRFELLTLHAALVLRAMRAAPMPGPAMAQDLADAVFRHLDRALREMGVGDLTVPKRIKSFAGDFVGRCAAYAAALDVTDATVLEATLKRNVYAPGEGDVERLARYTRHVEARLRAMPAGRLTEPGLFPAAANCA